MRKILPVVLAAFLVSFPAAAQAPSDAVKAVAGEWKRVHAPQRLLRWLERHHAWRRG